MNAYELELSISYLGGCAVVIANSPEEAIQMAKEYYEKLTGNDDFECKNISEPRPLAGVVQFWDGDY